MNIRNAAHFVGPVVDTPDLDAEETQDWIASLADVIERDGLGRAEFLVDRLIEAGRAAGGRFHTRHTTPYRNTIPVEAQPPYPGDLDLEMRLTAIHRWNALVMVQRANQAHAELGGHIATLYAAANPDSPVAPGRPDGNALPQSGQLNWPIPFMACSGVLLFAVGWVLDRKETLA